MCHVFMQDDADTLLHNKFVVIIGDSVQRGVYKDLVMLLNRNKYLTYKNLKSKGEVTFEGDELIEGGVLGKMVNGINYREVRQYNSEDHLIRFYFVTRCYNQYVESILLDLMKEPKPDVVMMNSCLWDITRYGRNAINEYKDNLQKCIKRFKETLPPHCLFVWNCTLPISRNARGGFLIPEVEFRNGTLRLDIIEANYYAREIVASHKFDVLDLHFHLRTQLNRRATDGIHWDNTAHRRITNLILTHIAKSWNFDFSSLVKNEEISITVNFKSSSEHNLHARSYSFDNGFKSKNDDPFYNSNYKCHMRSRTVDSGQNKYDSSYDLTGLDYGYGYGFNHSDAGFKHIDSGFNHNDVSFNHTDFGFNPNDSGFNHNDSGTWFNDYNYQFNPNHASSGHGHSNNFSNSNYIASSNHTQQSEHDHDYYDGIGGVKSYSVNRIINHKASSNIGPIRQLSRTVTNNHPYNYRSYH